MIPLKRFIPPNLDARWGELTAQIRQRNYGRSREYFLLGIFFLNFYSGQIMIYLFQKKKACGKLVWFW